MKAHTNTETVPLLLTWGTGHGDTVQSQTRSARARAGAATRRRNKERAARGERVAAYRRNGGVLLRGGPVILLGWGGWGAATASSIRRHARRHSAARAKARVLSGAVDVPTPQDKTSEGARALADRITARAWEIDSGEAGTLGERIAAAAAMAEAGKVTPAERAALGKAKRAARRERGERPAVAGAMPWHGGGLGGDAGVVHLGALALASARRWVRTWEASGGRPVDASTLDELSALYHARFARAVALCGIMPPDRGALWVRSGNVLSFRALLAWQRAVRTAGRDCRSYMWGKGWERCDVASLDDLTRLRAVVMGADDGRCWTVSSAQAATVATADDIGAERARERVRGPYVRRLCARWGDYLRVFWMLSGSRKWRAALASDLRLLATAARVARGEGLEALGEALGPDECGHAPGALREAVSQLRKRIAGGRELATGATWQAAESALDVRRMATRRDGDGGAAGTVARVPRPVGPRVPAMGWAAWDDLAATGRALARISATL